MNQTNSKGFFVKNPFFLSLNYNGNEEDLIQLIKSIKTDPKCDNNDYFYSSIIRTMKEKDLISIEYNDENYKKIAMKVIVSKAILSDFPYIFDYSIEEVEKLKSLLEKKQFESKLMTKFSGQLSMLLYYITRQDKNNSIYNLFILEIMDKVKEYNDKKIIEQYGDFKTTIDKITSGVNIKCYLQKGHMLSPLHREICVYIKDKHGYDFNEIKYDIIYREHNDVFPKILCSFLTNNDKFQDNFVVFLNNVLQFNGITHVGKIIDYCFDKFKATTIGKFIYEHKFPLFYYSNFEEHVMDFAYNWLKYRLFDINNSSLNFEDLKGFFNPLNPDVKSQIEEGKLIFENFIKEAYGNDYDKLVEIFKDTNNLIQESTNTKRQLSLKNMLECFLFGYDLECNACKFAYSYFPNFSTNESILGRFYYLISLIKKYIPDYINESIYEYMFDTFRMIDSKYQTTCKYTIDNKDRDEKYNKLKVILNKYNLNVDDSYKDKYIISLLDRKYATIEESSYFAQYEMLGDAIYDMAIEEILFYNDDENLDNDKKQDFAKAESQIKVAKMLGTDKLYISKYINAFSTKFDNNEAYEEIGYQDRKSHNYLADSLEMIIGVIYEEFGLTKALEFATNIIVKTYTELKQPKKLIFDDAFKSNFDEQYLEKILPNLINDDDFYSIYDNDYNSIEHTLMKVLMTISIGTDTKEKRNYITLNQHIYKLENSKIKSTQILLFYLYNGLEKTLQVFKQCFINEMLSK